MKNTKSKQNIKIFISSILIFISFFIWYYLSEVRIYKKLKDTSLKENYVNIEILKTKIKISKNDNTKIIINWEILKNNIYNLE
jgi:hypothetical protein